MTKKNKKIVIIGGGHNALTCSAYLAKTGFSVELYEARSQIGGMASTREFAKGYKIPGTLFLQKKDGGVNILAPWVNQFMDFAPIAMIQNIN